MKLSINDVQVVLESLNSTIENNRKTMQKLAEGIADENNFNLQSDEETLKKIENQVAEITSVSKIFEDLLSKMIISIKNKQMEV